MLEAKAKDQEHKCKCFPKKKGLKNFFSIDLQKKKTVKKNVFQPIYKILTIQKIVLSSSRGQAIFEDLRLRGQGQGLENVFSRPRTSSRTPPLLKSSQECIEEQSRALRHAPLTNIQKCLQRIFATLYFACSFFDYLFLTQFILRAIFLTINFDFDYIFLYI